MRLGRLSHWQRFHDVGLYFQLVSDFHHIVVKTYILNLYFFDLMVAIWLKKQCFQ
jgi:hypothetical protein